MWLHGYVIQLLGFDLNTVYRIQVLDFKASARWGSPSIYGYKNSHPLYKPGEVDKYIMYGFIHSFQCNKKCIIQAIH